MKDYVIINGVSSKTKTGLAINILPPITKPEMRTLVEEIDGRDGDIITKLGYSAYDKTIEIGLFGNGYDVDDIIAFFNKEGTIVFSNEPTKYYNFTLVDSFDIERLLQFKISTITFHCQPFKYEVGETPKEIEYDYVSDEGTQITLNNTMNALMELELNPSELTQETTTGKNKFNKSTSPNRVTECTLGILNTGLKLTATYAGTGNWQYCDFILFDLTPYKGKTVRLKSKINKSANTYSNYSLTRCDSSGTNRTTEATSSTSEEIISFTVPQDMGSLNYLRLLFQLNGGSSTVAIGDYVDFTNIILTIDNSDMTYEPYTGGIPQPNPDYPSDVQVIKGNNSIYITGKNIWNEQWELGTINNDGTLSTDTTRIRSKDYIPVIPNKTYYYYCSGASNSGRCAFYDENYTFVSFNGNFATNSTFTIPNNAYYFKFSPTSAYGTIYNNNICISQDLTITSYSPYQGEQVLSLNLPSGIEYCKIGTYEDEFEHDGDKWYLNKYIGKVVFDGSESWNSAYELTNTIIFYTQISDTPVDLMGICDYFTQATSWNDLTTVDTEKFALYNNRYCYLRINKSIASTTNAFKTWLQNNNVTIYYQLTTPTHEEITDTTLINQLNAIEQAVSYDEQTNISQINTGLPFIIKATAMISGSDSVEITNNGNVYAKPILDIKGTGIINVYLNGTQMFSVDITDEIIVDIPNLETYNPNTSALMNRNVTGNISNFVLPVGTNTITVDGAVEKVTITMYQRWL